jgi:hypothetical protein
LGRCWNSNLLGIDGDSEGNPTGDRIQTINICLVIWFTTVLLYDAT